MNTWTPWSLRSKQWRKGLKAWLQHKGSDTWRRVALGYTFVDADVGGGAFARVFLVRNEATHDLQAMKRYLAQQTTVPQSAAERDVAQTGTGQEI